MTHFHLLTIKNQLAYKSKLGTKAPC